ncbi:MAG: phosphoesterase [Acidobacteria bacterium]|nr:phosphoesterase [Acidobacteriota bacterium]
MSLWLLALMFAGLVLSITGQERVWLAGDSHIHSHWSSGYDRSVSPPLAIKGRDAAYSTPRNAAMARQFGLRWMVTTDHGGPNHSQLNLTRAYSELTLSRRLVPELLQFYGMELNMPGMDHHTLIIPQTEDEARILFEIESRFDANEDWALPRNPRRNSESLRSAALNHIRQLEPLPLLFANHPSRSALGRGRYGLDEPWELRGNNDVAPEVYRGMEGAPGHQAATLSASSGIQGRGRGFRGGYRNPGAHTLGGFDQMTAVVGGLWDALLGEGRRFWIIASSDSHFHYSDPVRPGSDFWPGEFHKTYVRAHPTYDDVLDGLRQGRVFVSAGGLVTELDIAVLGPAGGEAGIGETLLLNPVDDVRVRVRFRDPAGANHGGQNPSVQRVDLIMGEVTRSGVDPNSDRNLSTRVVRRFTPADWQREGEFGLIETTLSGSAQDRYLRVRGTSGEHAEPLMDEPGEDPWDDLWFYSNPIFLDVNEGRPSLNN